MKKLRIYLDTSVISFLFADDAPEKREVTREFFARVVCSCTADVYLSSVVMDELAQTGDVGRRRQLLDVAHEIARLDIEPMAETIELAQAYITHGAIPSGEYDDALHVATCSVHDIDVLVSWNFRHLANIKKEAQISAVNTLLGYRHVLRIITPHHLLYHD